MHLDEVQELFEYWQIYPPVRDLVAAFVGFKPTQKNDPKNYMTADDLRRMMAITGGKMPGMGPR